jgi:hypothetical protein
LNIQTSAYSAEPFSELRFVRKLPLQATNLHGNRAVASDSQLFTYLLKRHPSSMSGKPDSHRLSIITTNPPELLPRLPPLFLDHRNDLFPTYHSKASNFSMDGSKSG